MGLSWRTLVAVGGVALVAGGFAVASSGTTSPGGDSARVTVVESVPSSVPAVDGPEVLESIMRRDRSTASDVVDDMPPAASVDGTLPPAPAPEPAAPPDADPPPAAVEDAEPAPAPDPAIPIDVTVSGPDDVAMRVELRDPDSGAVLDAVDLAEAGTVTVRAPHAGRWSVVASWTYPPEEGEGGVTLGGGTDAAQVVVDVNGPVRVACDPDTGCTVQ